MINGTDGSSMASSTVGATSAVNGANANGGEAADGGEVVEAKPVLIGADDSGDPGEQQQQQNFTPVQPQVNAPMPVSTQQPQSPQADASCFLRCRGLPYSANENDVRKFFGEFTVYDVHFTSSVDGKPTGECYVQFGDRESTAVAQQKDRQTMGSRYIEVFQVGDVEMDQLMRRMQMKKTLSSKGFVRIRGLPYNCNKDQVQQFFRGLTVEEVVFGKEPGLEGRPTGEGFVRFSTADEAERALQQNNQHMGNRYLELFKSDGAAFEAFKARATNNIVPLKALAQATGDPYASYGYGPAAYGTGYEQRAAGGRPMGRGGYGAGGGGPASHRYSPYPSYPNYGYGTPRQPGGAGGAGGGGYGAGRGGGAAAAAAMGGGGYDDGYGGYGGGYNANPNAGPTKLYMRGIPFRLTANDIERFFSPLVCVDIQVGTMPDGRSSGDGIVEFQTPADARQAMSKDRECIGNRYVELFPSLSAKIPPHVTYESIGGKGGSGGGRGGAAVGPVMPSAAQQYAQHSDYSTDYSPYHQAVQQQVAAYASGNYPPSGASAGGMPGGAGAMASAGQHHQYVQYPGDYSTAYYGAYGGGDVGAGAQPKTDYNWPASQF